MHAHKCVLNMNKKQEGLKMNELGNLFLSKGF